jgi:hypothetical protein
VPRLCRDDTPGAESEQLESKFKQLAGAIVMLQRKTGNRRIGDAKVDAAARLASRVKANWKLHPAHLQGRRYTLRGSLDGPQRPEVSLLTHRRRRMRRRLNAQQADRPILRAATSAALNCQACANRRPLACRERARDRATAAREDDDSRTYGSVDKPDALTA